jgi:hypothetical protein
MQIEKKLILCSILAVAIGIAAVVPVAYFMNAKSNTIFATAETLDKPWFDISVPYAYFKANTTDNFYQSSTAIILQPTINNDVVSQQTDARIEYFVFDILNEQGLQLANATFSIGTNSSTIGDPSSLFTFNRENWFNSSAFGSGYYLTNLTGPVRLLGTGGSVICGYGDSNEIKEKFGAVLATMENDQTIYLEARRLGYVTFDGNDTIVTLAGDQIIQRLELTKTGDSFTYGNPAAVRDQFYSIPEPQY